MTNVPMPLDTKAKTDRGYTLVELLVALTLGFILMAMSLTVVNTFFKAERAVNTSYGNLNQLLPIGTSLQQFIRSAVSPAPTPTTPSSPGTPGQPVPPFGVYTSTGALTARVSFNTYSLTFFTNVDNQVAKIVAAYDKADNVFTATRTLATPTTCPTSDTSTTTCKFVTANERTADTVGDVANGTTPDHPIFTYYLTGSTTPVPHTELSADFGTCTKTTGHCDADDVQSIGVDLVVNENPAVGRSADQETVTYEISSSSQAFDPAVG